MAAKTISIDFDGYWRDENKPNIPDQSGVYCVYTCTHNKTKNTVSLHKLVYIGESDDVNARIAGHEKHIDWIKHVKSGDILCYSLGAVPSENRDRAEAALIFKQKPPENTEYIKSFPFDKTTISLSGKTRLLKSSFTVERTEED